MSNSHNAGADIEPYSYANEHGKQSSKTPSYHGTNGVTNIIFRLAVIASSARQVGSNCIRSGQSIFDME